MSKVAIGSRCIVRHSMFERRDAAGGYQRMYPPMTGDGERLQAALLTSPVRKSHGWVWTCAAAVAALVLIVSI